MADTLTAGSIESQRPATSYLLAGFRGAAALVTGRQFAHDRQTLIHGPQPEEIARPFAFLAQDMNDPLHRETLISHITRTNTDIPESFRSDLSTMPASAFAEKYASILRPMEIRVGTRPVRFDGKDFASSVSDFRIPDIDVGQQHVNLQFHLGDNVQVVDGYKTSRNGSRNVTTTGTIVAGMERTTERVAIHLNNMPARGQETITAGYDGTQSTSADTVFTGDAVEGLQHYLRSLETGIRLNLSDTAYGVVHSNGNTAAGVMLNNMGLRMPATIQDGKIIIDGKPRSVPAASESDIAALEERSRMTPAIYEPAGEPTVMDLVDRIGSAHRELRLTQPDAYYRANGPGPAAAPPAAPLAIEEDGKITLPGENGWGGLGRMGFGAIGLAPVAINLADAIIRGDQKKAVGVVATTGATMGGMKVATVLAGRIGMAEAIPIAGEAMGGIFAAADTYHALKTGHAARAAISGIEATLYAVSAGSACFGLAPIALVTGGAAVSITAGKAIYDNWDTIGGWFSNHAPSSYGSVTLRGPATRQLTPPGRASGRGSLRNQTAAANTHPASPPSPPDPIRRPGFTLQTAPG